MISTIFSFVVSKLLMTPFLAWGTCSGMIAFLGTFLEIKKNINKLAIIGYLFIFYCTIFVFYKNGMVIPPSFFILKELIFSAILGLLWMWIFLKIRHLLLEGEPAVKKVHIWSFFFVIAFAIYVLSRS